MLSHRMGMHAKVTVAGCELMKRQKFGHSNNPATKAYLN
jgi:hypothetical protein